jgi:hypothetical protein
VAYFIPIHFATDRYRASEGCLCIAVVAHDEVCEQGHDNGRATHDGVIVVAAFAMVLVSASWVGVAVALQVAGAVHVLDVLGEYPVVCRR